MAISSFQKHLSDLNYLTNKHRGVNLMRRAYRVF